jgi:hypothetical protein
MVGVYILENPHKIVDIRYMWFSPGGLYIDTRYITMSVRKARKYDKKMNLMSILSQSSISIGYLLNQV